MRALRLAAFSATAAGVMPALRVTGRSVQGHLQRTRGNRSGVRFGGLSGALIVADVAVSMVVVSLAIALSGKARETWRATDAVGIPAHEYLAVQVRLPGRASGAQDATDDEAFRRRAAALQTTLVDRLAAEPGIRGVAVAGALPPHGSPGPPD